MKISYKLLAIISFLLIYFIFEYTTQSLKEKKYTNMVDTVFEELREKGVTVENKNLSYDEKRKIANQLKKPLPNKKLLKLDAIVSFLVFHRYNTKIRLDFCKKRNVDISNFKGVFLATNKKDYERATSYLSINPNFENTIYSEYEVPFQALIKKEMELLASNEGITTKEVCEGIFTYPDNAVQIINTEYREINKKLYNILTLK